MAAGVVFMQWHSYAGGAGGPAFFAEEPLTFNSRQERLHRLAPGDRLWLVSRRPEDGQYYFFAALLVGQPMRNPPGSERATLFGEYAILADRSQSHDLGRRFPAEGLLRAFTFETGRPIRYGAQFSSTRQLPSCRRSRVQYNRAGRVEAKPARASRFSSYSGLRRDPRLER